MTAPFPYSAEWFEAITGWNVEAELLKFTKISVEVTEALHVAYRAFEDGNKKMDQ